VQLPAATSAAAAAAAVGGGVCGGGCCYVSDAALLPLLLGDFGLTIALHAVFRTSCPCRLIESISY
jgi:hypothetical protein